ncbi:uncharacterized protein G2W53_039089 [Senna tora]|uniref:Uncharacterized protein n=1 Tax=Senna tora TaxID=362788 RepID=A0A834W337_9FABA|nr:uncharacterized protein G2W53_039089 [Senna tora]
MPESYGYRLRHASQHNTLGYISFGALAVTLAHTTLLASSSIFISAFPQLPNGPRHVGRHVALNVHSPEGPLTLSLLSPCFFRSLSPPCSVAGDRRLAGEMNIPANLSSLSMNNARLSDHRRHVFHENPECLTLQQ